MPNTVGHTPDVPPVFIISGGAGALGKHLARVALAQFPTITPQIIVIPQVHRLEQLVEAIERVANLHGIIIHTMVDHTMHDALVRLAREKDVPTIDTTGDALARLGSFFAVQPLGRPGLYQGQEELYLKRIEAIEFAVEHDDGRKPHELNAADVVLTGVSRVGKTPLSIYLSVLGWKVANVPLVPNVEPPHELFAIDRRRVVGLTIHPDVLVQHRRWRSCAVQAGRSYSDYEALCAEIESVRRVFRRGGFTVLDVTDKPIEESADQVIERINRWFEHRMS